MSPNNAVPIDARREEFRKYLDKEGILESISKAFVALYEEPDKPTDPLLFVRNNLAGSEMQDMILQLENSTKENEQLKSKVSTLEKNKAALEKAFVDYKMEEEVTDANDEKKDEIQGSPKQVDEVKVSNESPMETVLVSAEKSTMSPSSETPPVVKETKISEEVTLPTALEVPEEPKTS